MLEQISKRSRIYYSFEEHPEYIKVHLLSGDAIRISPTMFGDAISNYIRLKQAFYADETNVTDYIVKVLLLRLKSHN
jgi:hypothetical protein